MFDDLDEISKPNNDFRYFDAPGRIRVELTSWQFKRSEKDKAVKRFIATFKVVGEGAPKDGYHPGDVLSWLKRYGFNERTNTEIKALAAAILGVQFQDATSELIKSSLENEALAVIGTTLDVTITASVGKDGNTYYNPAFRFVAPPDPNTARDGANIPF